MIMWFPQGPALPRLIPNETRGFSLSPNMLYIQWLSHVPTPWPLSPLPSPQSLEKITRELLRREMWLERKLSRRAKKSAF